MHKRGSLILFSILAALAMAVLGWGCSASNGSVFGAGGDGVGGGGTSSSSTSTSTSSGGQGGGCLINCGTGGGNTSSSGGAIVLTPANPMLLVNNGMIPTQPMTATLNGSDVTAQVQWLYERPDVGDMAATTFKPTGLVGGSGKLTATLAKATGSTNVTVTIKKVANTGGLTGAQQAAFDNPVGPDPGGLKIVYPFPETVFPLGVLSPEVQWNGANAGDFYRIKITEKYYTYTEYFNTPVPARHLISEDDWKSIENSGTGATSDPLTMGLSRMVGSQAYQAEQMTLHVAQGRLHGSVYYWELPDQGNPACGNQANGRVLRIKPDSTMVDEFYAPGSCYGCHTVSRDGKTMAAAFSEGVPFPQRSIDLSANPVVLGTLNNPGVGGTFMAFNEKGDKLLASNDSASNPSGDVLRIVDVASGNILNPNAMGNGCGEPAWSPDGKKIAAICGLGGGGWIFDATSGVLTIADIAPDGITVSNQKTIVPQGSPGRPAYPSFSPGTEWLAFGRPTSGSRSTAPGDIWLTAPDGSVTKQLAAASVGGNSYNPVFAPLRAGGFFWLVYISRRDYGNELVATNRQQLWVTAIDDPPSAPDPSHPPFYMRGQEMCGLSENAYYALDPCKAVGSDCVSGIDCCNGQCVKDPNSNKYVCGTPPPPGQCSADGNACKVTADCCNAGIGVQCIDGFCQLPPPK